MARFFAACVCFSLQGEVFTAVESRTPALTALSAGADRLASGADVVEALQAVAETARAAAAADLAVVRLVDRGELVVRAVAGNAALAAEIEGSRVVDAAPDHELDQVEELSPGLRRIAERRPAKALAALDERLLRLPGL